VIYRCGYGDEPLLFRCGILAAEASGEANFIDCREINQAKALEIQKTIPS
jgi:hypothetical protein